MSAFPYLEPEIAHFEIRYRFAMNKMRPKHDADKKDVDICTNVGEAEV